MHKPTDKVQVGVPAVEEHREPGLLRQVELLLKVPARETKEEQKERRNNRISISTVYTSCFSLLSIWNNI